MNFDLVPSSRVPKPLLIVVAILLLGLLFNNSAGTPVVSTWSGNAIASQNVGAAAPQLGLTGVFDKQATSALSTGLASAPKPQDEPWGNPADSTRLVLTQDYGAGTHVPTPTWGGLDLAIDGNGDGQADPQGSMGAPLYATMSGVVELTPNSVPAGNHLWIKNDRFKVGYAHMQAYTVQDGAIVKRGDLIGYMGASGQASGPHLHYHIWQAGTNVNPLDFGVLSAQ